MSSLYVIQLSTKPIEEDSRKLKESDLYEDALFLQRTDFCRAPLTDEEAASLLKDYVKPALEKVAVVDPEKRTLTFRDRDTVLAAYTDDFALKTATYLKALREGRLDHWRYRRDIDSPFGFDDLIYGAAGNFCQSLADVLADYVTSGIGQTMHFGTILNCHC